METSDFMVTTYDGKTRQAQKVILKTEFQDYTAMYHDVFVRKHNLQIDKINMDNYLKERNILKKKGF